MNAHLDEYAKVLPEVLGGRYLRPHGKLDAKPPQATNRQICQQLHRNCPR
jgi:hypothetical protein